MKNTNTGGKVDRVKAAIEAGEYPTERMIDLTVERLMLRLEADEHAERIYEMGQPGGLAELGGACSGEAQW
jgi:hypothetical protein